MPSRNPPVTQHLPAEVMVWGLVHPTSCGSLTAGLFPIRQPTFRGQGDTNSRENLKNATTSGRCLGKTLGMQANWGLLLASPAKSKFRQVWLNCFFLSLVYLKVSKPRPRFWCHDARWGIVRESWCSKMPFPIKFWYPNRTYRLVKGESRLLQQNGNIGKILGQWLTTILINMCKSFFYCNNEWTWKMLGVHGHKPWMKLATLRRRIF